MKRDVTVDFEALARWKVVHGIPSNEKMCTSAGLQPDALDRIRQGGRLLAEIVDAFYSYYGIRFAPDDELSIYQYV